jgi:putative ABC transport system ATP-binding protein
VFHKKESETAAPPLVRLGGVTKRYGQVTALDRVTLDIGAGEWLAVMGPSGSGKTTLLNLLAGLDRADAGEIRVGEAQLETLGESGLTRYRREVVGLVFQQFHLLPYLTALENVMVAQHYHSLADADEAAGGLERVGLGDFLSRRPGELSGGEQQRVCIARALINHPKLILADEPTGNLDEENERRVLEILGQLHRAGHTLVVVTHSPHVGALADRRIELRHGHVSHVSVPDSQNEMRYDHVLERMWFLREEGKPTLGARLRLPDVIDPEPTIRALAERGWVLREGDSLEFTSEGEDRARDLVRRHRLAECMMSGTLALDDRQLTETACRMEHILEPAVAEAICGHLQHPRSCPHGRAIPRGKCCAE